MNIIQFGLKIDPRIWQIND